MTTQTATLVAAGISAVAAVLVLVGNLLGARGAEARAAHRQILEAHMASLAEALHEVVASAVIVHRRRAQGQSPGSAGENGLRAADVLKQKRPTVKYPLAGLDEALRTLSRVPDWTLTYKGHKTGDDLVEKASRLGRLVDGIIARSYSKGRPPNAFERWRARGQAKKLRSSWDRRFAES